MSTFIDREIQCDGGHRFEVKVGVGIHGSRLPLVRQQILDGELHRFRCPECDRSVVLEVPLVYTDFVRGHYVAVELPESDLDEARERHRAIFESSVGAVSGLADGLRFRVASGRDGLRELLLAWEHAYDDRVIERLKGEILATTSLPAPISLDSVSSEALCFRAADGQRWPIDALVYDAYVERWSQS